MGSVTVQLLKSADLGRQSLLYLKEIGHGWFGKVSPGPGTPRHPTPVGRGALAVPGGFGVWMEGRACPSPQVFLGEVNSGISSTQVVVKELKASASVQDQMQFLEEAQPYRYLWGHSTVLGAGMLWDGGTSTPCHLQLLGRAVAAPWRCRLSFGAAQLRPYIVAGPGLCGAAGRGMGQQ